ncbi:UbiA family prenyltransferase [Desulforhopalus vacuolatus]|uniref:UbiA family prenyltransferase n=1 Tax=Desulforhopalus vacuolatus TaxID=40414 RepID=UPI001965F45E|nr:UbiA family prenyltransferase [Desulforhopalus vacuolatus]MBM9518261.1 UbiA family prenyltransferase [Desulforhopalus vacuolatus]
MSRYRTLPFLSLTLCVILIMLTNIKPYIQIAIFDHWFKNVFMLPGVVLAFYAVPPLFGITALWQLLLALLATGFVASSNYVINELLDAPLDTFHPVKKFRPLPSGKINKSLVYYEWILLAVIGISLAACLGSTFFLIDLSLWIMVCIYNIPPFRSKDKPYLDVLSESINNPIRLLLGRYATGIAICPSPCCSRTG